MTAQALFDSVAERLLREDDGLEKTRMMGSEGLKTGGKFFAMVSRGELVVKLPRERVESSSRPGRGIASTPATGG